MKIHEVLAGRDPLRQQLDVVKKQEKGLKLQKARIKAQQSQQQLRAAQASARP